MPRRIKTVQLLLAALALHVPGDVVECGTNAGGTAALQVSVLLRFSRSRLFFGADSFQGLPAPTAYDAIANPTAKAAWRRGTYSVSRGRFNHTLNSVNVHVPSRIRVLEGFFADTLPAAPIGEIAFLRLDGDLYASTMDALNALYEKVSIGGFIYVDDYAGAGCRRAITEFRSARGIATPLVKIDEDPSRGLIDNFEAVWWQKER